jgi:hypothetical protein
MPDKLKYIFILLICLSAGRAFAQYPTNQPGNYGQQGGQQRPANFNDTARNHTQNLTEDQQIDTLRKQEENARDSVIFSSKFIRVTNESLLRDSTQVFLVDTGLTNFENYSPLYQPLTPKIGLGNLGLAERDLLFQPQKNIGFDAGQHAYDVYLLHPEDIQYYRARVPYTVLKLVTGETNFELMHTQNVNPNLNVGLNLNFNGSRGTYASTGVLGQNVSDINAAFFTWYESKNKRYNLLANVIYNNIKAPETGSVSSQYDAAFTDPPQLFYKNNAEVKLPNTYENWHDNGFYLKQFYYIGHLDSMRKGNKDTSKILPTQRVAYTFYYNVRTYEFLSNDMDTAHVFPDYYYSANRSRDSLTVTHLQNDFSYSFYLRSKATKSVNNEARIDVGLTQDFYHYSQYVSDSTINQYGALVPKQVKMQQGSFQDITVRGKISYRFSDKLDFEGDVHQIVQGRDFGNFIYEGKLMVAGNNSQGKIILDAYTESTAPPLVYTDWTSNHYIFHNSFANQKTNSFSFNYINTDLQLDVKAEYFLISDYLYFNSLNGSNDAEPTQLSAPINLLKVTLTKNLAWRRWHFDNSVVYQKTDYQSTLRTPEVYSYTSLYYARLLFNVLNTNVGMDVRYNTPYVAPSYAVGLGQFYNGPNVTFSSYPVATVFLKATLYRTNLFVMYDYANQGLLSNGFYTVNRYPMQDRQLRFGVAWTFYN